MRNLNKVSVEDVDADVEEVVHGGMVVELKNSLILLLVEYPLEEKLERFILEYSIFPMS